MIHNRLFCMRQALLLLRR